MTRTELLKKMIPAVLSFFIHSTGWSTDLTPESKLRKLSYQVRGLPPSSKDFEDLAKAQTSASETSAFFKAKLDEYFNSPWAAVKLSEKIFEDWRLENGSDYLKDLQLKQDKADGQIELSYPVLTVIEKSLVKQIQNSLSKGQTWDQLLVQGSFRRTLDLSIVLQQFKDNYQKYGFNTKIQNFRNESIAKGLSLDTAEKIQIAITEFEKNTQTSTNTLSSMSPTPYFNNSKADPTFTVLIIQGALDGSMEKLQVLANYLDQKKDLLKFRDEVLGLSTASNTLELPQLIFSLSEMTDRYKKTIYSKAAGFFRIYLCDDMSPVIVPGKNSKSQEAFKIVHSPTPLSGAPPAPATSTPMIPKSDLHLKPECAGCHKKLNPMETILNAKFVGTDPVAKKSNPFQFIYEDYTGKDITIKLDNVEQLPEVLMKQPQYVRCQSEKFWNWYVGTDVPLSPKQRSELEAVYVASNSQPIKIIKYLTSLSLFSSDSFLNEPKQFNNVRPLLQRCQGCHRGDPTIPSLLNIPFNLDKSTIAEKMADHFEILEKIIELTSILNDQGKPRMPPKNAGWHITEDEKLTLIKWINDGAKDEMGNDTITSEQKSKLLSPAKNETMERARRSSKIEPSLKPTWQRILNYNDILRTLPIKFGKSINCFDSMVARKLALGHPDIYTGEPRVNQPDNAYREAYRSCLVQVLAAAEQEFQTTSTLPLRSASIQSPGAIVNQLKPLGLTFLLPELVKIKPDENPLWSMNQMSWAMLPPDRKLKMVQDQIAFVLGPNMNHIEGEKDLDKYILTAIDKVMTNNQSSPLVSAAFFSLYYILNSDSFFIY